jgi:hypothetical protein
LSGEEAKVAHALVADARRMGGSAGPGLAPNEQNSPVEICKGKQTVHPHWEM